MKRYHKDISFPTDHQEQLKGVNAIFNNGDSFIKTTHGIDRLDRFRLIEVLTFLSSVRFSVKDIFEYYINEHNIITKVCYRLKYNDSEDLIIVLGREKTMITMYLNNTSDSHSTLKRELYTV